MSAGVRQEPAYVIHRRPYRETSLLVDVFALGHGRISLVARGATSPKSPLKAQLQPFQPLLLDWSGRSDLKTLTQAENRRGPLIAGGQALYCGFYLNELLQLLLPGGDPHPELFAAYIQALESLAEEQDIEPVLRRFERALCDSLGYGFRWGETDQGAGVQAQQRYCYDPQQGIVAVPTGQSIGGLSGEALLALDAGDLESAEARRTAKRVMRTLIDFLLQGRPLKSRDLFRNQGRKRNE
jgi:DNA repair protein RecO (recombination protein O)